MSRKEKGPVSFSYDFTEANSPVNYICQGIPYTVFNMFICTD